MNPSPPSAPVSVVPPSSFTEQHPDPVLRFDAAGTLTYANQAARELARGLGRSDPAELLPPGLAPTIQACLQGQRVQLESTVGGRTFSWLFFPGQPGLVVHCQVSDITERQQLEMQLRHAQRLDSVGRLAAGIAHDFNNVLTVIKGHSGLLRSESETAANPSMAECVQQIARAADRGSKLTGQLLAFSRRNVLQPRPVALNELLTNLSNLLQRTLGEDITYQFSYAPDLPPIQADPSLLEQVIMNLAVNAREAMPKGGQLVVSTSALQIDDAYVQRRPGDARPGRFVCLTMSDTGCGMDQTILGRLFEPFFTTKETAQSRGLGLATVYGIVKQHFGWIEVRSQPGQGSTFRVFLPPNDAPARPESGLTSNEQVPRGDETILVVEDEPPVRWIIKEALTKYGYHVLEAGNGVEALAQWHQHHANIAMLLTDMVMPVGLSGQELAEKFCAQKPGLKVIYISGYSLQAASSGVAVLDGPNFLQKPFDGANLARAVRHCLET